MLIMVTVVMPILFVLLSGLAVLAFAQDDTSSARSQQSMSQDEADEVNRSAGAQIILFRPSKFKASEGSSVDEIVAGIEDELQQRRDAALKASQGGSRR